MAIIRTIFALASQLLSVAMVTTRLKLLVALLMLQIQQSCVAETTSAGVVSTASDATSSSSVGQCAPLKTLSFDCASECGMARPCIRYQSLAACSQSAGGAGESPTLSACIAQTNSSSTSTSSSCGVECFKMGDRDASATGNRSAGEASVTSFQFFIPFSLKNLGGRPMENATGGFPSKNEDAVQEIAVLNVPNTVTDVYDCLLILLLFLVTGAKRTSMMDVGAKYAYLFF